MALEHGQKVLLFARAAQETFMSSQWTEVGYLTGTYDWINAHPRLLRSLSFGDDDYGRHALDAIALMLKNGDNVKRLLEYQPIADWLRANEPGAFEELRQKIHGITVPEVLPQSASAAALAALADAQTLLTNRGPVSAVDRVHTGLHGYLKSACASARIDHPDDATANRLLKLLLGGHPALAELGARGDDVKRMLYTGAAIIDAMGTVRNNASLAHPNEELLGHDEALLSINLGRSLLGYLDAKLSPPQRR